MGIVLADETLGIEVLKVPFDRDIYGVVDFSFQWREFKVLHNDLHRFSLVSLRWSGEFLVISHFFSWQIDDLFPVGIAHIFFTSQQYTLQYYLHDFDRLWVACEERESNESKEYT